MPLTGGAVICPSTLGLSEQAYCCTLALMALAVGSLVSDRLGLDMNRSSQLCDHLAVYFLAIPIASKNALSIFTQPSDWSHMAKYKTDEDGAIDAVTRVAISLMSQLGAAANELVHTRIYFCKDPESLKFQPFMEWATHMKGRRHAANLPPPPGGRPTSGNTGSVLIKIPSFDVPLFNGNMIEGHSYIQDVQDTFRSSAMEDYLDSEAHCDQNKPWSGAFASRIRESLKDSPLLSFLSTELNQENNCAKVWMRIKNHLSSEDVVTARVMNLWTKLFALKCDDRDSFMAFYSQVKGITHKLTEHSSVAVQDDIFMQALLSRTIEAPELQSEVKNFLKEPKIQYLEILEKVYVDYGATETSEHFQQETQAFSATARIARKAVREQNSTDIATKPPPILFRFPWNSDNKIPPDIYTQVCEWFKRAIKPEPDKTDADKEFLDKFVFKVSQSGKKPPCNGLHAGGSSGKYGNDYGDRRSF